MVENQIKITSCIIQGETIARPSFYYQNSMYWYFVDVRDFVYTTYTLKSNTVYIIFNADSCRKSLFLSLMVFTTIQSTLISKITNKVNVAT